MEALLLILVLSVLFNLMLFAWGARERQQRQELQEDVVVLARALQTARSDDHSQQGGIGCMMTFILGFFFLILSFLAQVYPVP